MHTHTHTHFCGNYENTEKNLNIHTHTHTSFIDKKYPHDEKKSERREKII